MFARQEPMHNFHPPQRAKAPGAQARKDRCQTDYTSRGPTQSVRSARTDAQLPSALKGKCARRACSGRPMPKQTTRPEDQHNVFARQEPMHNFHQPHRGQMRLTRTLGGDRCKTPVETPGIRGRKTIGGRVGPGKQAKHIWTVTGTQTFVKQNGRNISNDTSLSTIVPSICFPSSH